MAHHVSCHVEVLTVRVQELGNVRLAALSFYLSREAISEVQRVKWRKIMWCGGGHGRVSYNENPRLCGALKFISDKV